MVNNDTIKVIIEQWNSRLKSEGMDYRIRLDVTCRTKKFWVCRENHYEKKIGELKFIKETVVKNSKEPDLMLFHKETFVPLKVKGVTQLQLEQDVIDDLYRCFLYECIAIFAMTCEQAIKANDYSEWDIKKDRVKGDPKFEDCVVEAVVDGKWFEKGNTFDVFTKRDNGWIVYTGHDVGRANNGLAMLPGTMCKVIVQPKVKLDLEIVGTQKIELLNKG